MAGKKKASEYEQLRIQLKAAKVESKLHEECAESNLERLRKAQDDYNKLAAETREENRPLFYIEALFKGGKRTDRIRRVNCGLSSHELLGHLEMAVEEVKMQIRGHMAQPQRLVMENTEQRAPATHR